MHAGRHCAAQKKTKISNGLHSSTAHARISMYNSIGCAALRCGRRALAAKVNHTGPYDLYQVLLASRHTLETHRKVLPCAALI